MDEKKRKAAFVEACKGKPGNRATFVNAFFKSTFDTWENVNRTGEEKYYVGYNPVQVFDTDKILADFPQGHVIHVARNPYSGFADTSKRPFPLSLKKYAWTWNLNQHMALTYKEKYPDRFHLVRFEDIVADTPKAMEGLLKRLGLPMSDKCTVPSFNGVKLEQVYPWGTIRIPTPAANMATANELTTEQKRDMKTETIVMQRLLGYENFL
jgi:ribosomal protein S10